MSKLNKKVYQEVLLENGDKIVLIKTMGPTPGVTIEEVNCNVYRINSKGDIVWQIDIPIVTRYDGTYKQAPVVYIGYDQYGKFIAAAFNGIDYHVNVNTGKIISSILTK